MPASEDEEYMTLAQAAEEIGVKRASIYYYIKALEIETRKFPLNKHAYIKKRDVERIKVAKNSPWKADEAA
jgi:hypothetical protein